MEEEKLGPSYKILRYHFYDSGFYPLHSGIKGHFFISSKKRWDLNVTMLPVLALWRGKRMDLGGREGGHYFLNVLQYIQVRTRTRTLVGWP